MDGELSLVDFVSFVGQSTRGAGMEIVAVYRIRHADSRGIGSHEGEVHARIETASSRSGDHAWA
jgi:hypothetical protein